jgi:integral membrane protein
VERNTGEYCGAGNKLLKTQKSRLCWFIGKRLNNSMNNEALKKTLNRFRMIALAEGVSFLILLGIAMPLKYVANLPQAVKYAGWAHGVLFVAFIYFMFEVFGAFKKPFLWLIKAFAASLLPFGTFVLDKELKKEALSL